MSQATTSSQKLGNYSDAQYHRLVQAMQDAFLDNIEDQPLFTTDLDDLWEVYLESFADPVTKQYHNCSACRHFIQRFGHLVTIDEDGNQRPDTADEAQNRKQEQLTLQGINEIGMPAITKFSEKRMMKTILELRDKEVPTYTYLVGMNNELKLLCHSMGFGLPYSTQYTAPERPAKAAETFEQGNITLPQADPNGLYSPASSDGSWIQCVNPETKQANVVYIEPRVIVSPFPLQ